MNISAPYFAPYQGEFKGNIGKQKETNNLYNYDNY